MTTVQPLILILQVYNNCSGRTQYISMQHYRKQSQTDDSCFIIFCVTPLNKNNRVNSMPFCNRLAHVMPKTKRCTVYYLRRHIRMRREVGPMFQRNVKIRFVFWFVKARKRTSGFRRLKVGHGEPTEDKHNPQSQLPIAPSLHAGMDIIH